MTHYEKVLSNFFHDDKRRYDVLLSWQRTTKSSKSDDLSNYIINSEEFITYYRVKCQSILELIFHTNNKKEYDKYISCFFDIVKKTRGYNLSMFEVFIKESVIYKRIYMNLIRRMYMFMYRVEIRDSDMNKMFEDISNLNVIKYKTKEKYQSDIQKIVYNTYEFTTEPSDNIFLLDEKVEYFVSKYAYFNNKKPSKDEIERFRDAISTQNGIIDMYMKDQNKSNDMEFQTLLEVFLKYFERDMTVYEYKQFSLYFIKNIEKNVAEYKNIYDRLYSITENMFNIYCNEKLTHDIFIKRFIFRLDIYVEKEFLEYVKTYLVNLKTYNQLMLKHIKDVYRSNYNKHISGKDNGYFFERIRKEKYHLQDNQLPKFIDALKKQTDKFVIHLEEKYINILRRKPDEKETDKYMYYYRTYNDAHERIEEELYDNLEYNDVLKQKLTEVTGVTNPSIVYSLLKLCLESENKELKRNDELLRKFCQKREIIQLLA